MRLVVTTITEFYTTEMSGTQSFPMQYIQIPDLYFLLNILKLYQITNSNI